MSYSLTDPRSKPTSKHDWVGISSRKNVTGWETGRLTFPWPLMTCCTQPGWSKGAEWELREAASKETRRHALPFIHFLGLLSLSHSSSSSLYCPCSLGLLGHQCFPGLCHWAPLCDLLVCLPFTRLWLLPPPTNPLLLKLFFHWTVSRQLVSSMSSTQFIAPSYRSALPLLVFLWRAVKGPSSSSKAGSQPGLLFVAAPSPPIHLLHNCFLFRNTAPRFHALTSCWSIYFSAKAGSGGVWHV